MISEEEVRRLGEVLEWDVGVDAAAEGHRTRIAAPGAASFICGVAPYWRPGMQPREVGDQMYAPVSFLELPMPGSHSLGARFAQENLQPLPVGEALACTFEITGYKRAQTRVGDGAFIDVAATVRDRRGEKLAVATWTVLRYDPGGPSNPGGTRRAAAVDVPRPVYVSEIGLDLQRLVMWAGVIRDFAPIHFDRDAARSAGAPDAFINTQLVHALYERALRECLGPDVRLARVGPFRMVDFALCNTVLRTYIGAPRPRPRLQDSVVVDIWQECDGRVTSVGEALVYS